MSRLQGKTAVVTGGGTGIGFGAAKRFIDDGAFVYLFGRRQEPLDAAVAKLGSSARAVRGSVTDLSDLDCYQLASAFQQRAGLCRARLIALTAEIAATDRQAALSAGFEQFLTLPLQQTALERVLTGRSHRGLDRTSGH